MRGYQALSRDINGRAACRAPMARCSPGLDLGRRAGVFCSRKLFGETTRRPRPRLLALALEHRQAGSGETVWQARFDSSSAWEVVLRSAFVPRTKLPHAVKLTLPPCPIYSGPEPRPETEGVVGRPSTADLVARGAAADATARLPSKLGSSSLSPPGGHCTQPRSLLIAHARSNSATANGVAALWHTCRQDGIALGAITHLHPSVGTSYYQVECLTYPWKSRADPGQLQLQGAWGAGWCCEPGPRTLDGPRRCEAVVPLDLWVVHNNTI